MNLNEAPLLVLTRSSVAALPTRADSHPQQVEQTSSRAPQTAGDARELSPTKKKEAAALLLLASLRELEAQEAGAASDPSVGDEATVTFQAEGDSPAEESENSDDDNAGFACISPSCAIDWGCGTMPVDPKDRDQPPPVRDSGTVTVGVAGDVT